MGHTIRGELRCFACSRYLGDFESHPDAHGRGDVHFRLPEGGTLAQQAVRTDHGLRCSHCGGRVLMDYIERIAA